MKKVKLKNSDDNSSKKLNIYLKIVTIINVVLLCALSIYVMKYFFVDRNNIKMNYSTDKKLVYINVNDQEKLISTQKYISDVGYSMRYDIENFKVFKYKNQDIFKNIKNENVLILIERSDLSLDCNEVSEDGNYKSCNKTIDDSIKQILISSNNKSYKILVKDSGIIDSLIKSEIDYMIKSFEVNN